MNREDSCVVCGKSDQLFRCSRCKSSFYCSKEHQHQHWKFHKNSCQPVNVTLSAGNVESERPQGGIGASGGLKSLSQYQVAGGQVVRPADVHGICQSQYDTAAANSFLTNHNQVHDSLDFAGLSLQSEASGYVYESAGRTMPPVSVASVAGEQQNVLFEEIASVFKQQPFQHSLLQKHSLLDPMKRHTAEWILQVSQFVINDLDKYGICVVDNFLGKERGDVLLKTVQSMYDSGVFQEGEVVSNKVKTSRNIRGDKITWVDGTEPNTSPISYLISMVDSVIMHAKRMKRGKLTQYDIGGRTKAMVACYPGHGTHYVKHVDNPNRDGRCITSIYYLNKEWDIKSDGGLLRIFPEGWSNQVADIEPIFDRMLFFWSDRRNPHEVQPAFRTRYAITLWYFDAKEREEARLRHQKEGSNVVQTKKPAAEDPKD